MAGFIGNQPSQVPLTSADIADGTITNDDLAGSITDAKISALSASKLTGSLPASMETDLSPVRSDILKLALHQAIDGNRVAYNLEDSFIDGFEDDTGITTETTVDRDTTSEYVASIYTTDVVTTPSTGDWTGDTGSFTITSGGADCTNGDDAIKSNWTSGTGDFTIQLTVTAYSNQTFGVYPVSEDGSFTTDSYGGMSGMTNSWWWTGNSTAQAANAQYRGYNQNTSVFSDGDIIEDGSVVQIKRVSGTISILIDGTSRHTYSQTSSADLRFVVAHHGTTSGNVQSMTFTASSSSTNATGTLISDPQTASTSRTSCSGVIIYSDAAGTNTLGTDLKIYFSCNNSAWTEASSYGTATTYSGTKKLVKLGATTCTAGTSVAMKAVWANQSASNTAIADDAGTIIGDFTTNPSNAFNNTVSTRTNSAQRSTSTNAYIGKDLGAGNGRPITGASWDRPTDADSMDSASTMTTYLYASNSAPTSYNDGTLLGTIGTETNNTGTSQMSKLDFSNSTTYRYVWIHASSPSSNNFWCAEAKFYGTDLTSKEARLHGWAVNY